MPKKKTNFGWLPSIRRALLTAGASHKNKKYWTRKKIFQVPDIFEHFKPKHKIRYFTGHFKYSKHCTALLGITQPSFVYLSLSFCEYVRSIDRISNIEAFVCHNISAFFKHWLCLMISNNQVTNKSVSLLLEDFIEIFLGWIV